MLSFYFMLKNGKIWVTLFSTFHRIKTNEKSETLFFNLSFFVLDISLDMALIISSFSMPVGNNHIEGTMSQIFDLGLVFILC